MNLKRVVTSMCVIGLVSSPAFSGDHVYHKHYRHHSAKPANTVALTQQDGRDEVGGRDYKDYKYDYKDTGPTQFVAAPCSVTQSSIILNNMTQNTGRFPNACESKNWYDRVAVSGGVNVDLLKIGSRRVNFMGQNYQRLSLNDAYINIGAVINNWASAFASVSYDTATISAPDLAAFDGFPPPNPVQTVPEYSAAYANNIHGGASHTLQLEQAYATFANFNESPVFIQVGKQFQDFSRYTIHPITRTLTQVLSETLATSAKIGFIAPIGVNGSIYVFDDPLHKRNSAGVVSSRRSVATNYGISLGYDQPNDNLGFDVGLSWLRNLIGVNDVAYAVNQYTLGAGYHRRVSGLALYGDVNSGPFVVGARYTTALKRFNPLDLPRYADFVGPTAPVSGAKPWAAGIQAAYNFDGMGQTTQNVYLGYQASRQALALNIPRSRWLVGYGVTPCKGATFALEFNRDKDYSTSQGGTNKHYNLLTLRTSVQFG